jgi:hypothetical protein
MLLQKSEPQRAAKQQRLLRSSSAKAGKDRLDSQRLDTCAVYLIHVIITLLPYSEVPKKIFGGELFIKT